MRLASGRAVDAGSGSSCSPTSSWASCRQRRAESRRHRAEFARSQFEVEAPNKKWVADFTYIWTAEGWLYVSAAIDLFSRRVVGWSMKAEMTAQLVTDALVMAIWRRGKPDALLHHSDRGSPSTPASSSSACSQTPASPVR